MAILFLEGFESYGPEGTNAQTLEDRLRGHWDAVECTTLSSETKIAAGRGGMGKSLHWNDTGRDHWMKKYFAPISTLYIGFNYFVPANITSGDYIFFLYHQSTLQMRLATWNDGSLAIYRSSTMLEQTAPMVLRGNSWHRIEVMCFCDNAGSYEVRVNGNTVLSGTGIDTDQAGSGLLDTILFRAGYSASLLGDIYLADDTGGQDFMGELKVETIRPSADTAQADWTPSTGIDNYAMVDDEYSDDTTYVEGAVTDDKDLYDFGDLVNIESGIVAIQVSTVAMVTAASALDMIPVLKSGATEQDADTRRVTGNAGVQYLDVYMQDPNTASDWAVAGVNAIQSGVKVG